MKGIKVFVISDSVGETGEQVAKAVLSQFRPNYEETVIRRFPYTRTEEGLTKIIHYASVKGAMVIYTLVKNEMRTLAATLCTEQGVHGIDVLGPVIGAMDNILDEAPLEKPGIMHQLDEDYFKKIEAIEFAVKYDDGRDPRGLLQADIVLIGVSRTSKTPLSQYLAHQRFKVANVPLVPEVDPPKELFQVPKEKCIGLVISPEKLNFIRQERLLALGLNNDALYAQHSRIEEELQYFNRIVEQIGCQVIDVTNKAVEETANRIIRHLHEQKQ
ncbi:putative pyruvate, phosphate dikinase regulatory protein [Lysinibacillus alkalisoli]|uniref:Putative pyruvate, phosphate dikinase regulatory protein n=1 Tax=Lysinibacillus alkalisoli TaxID=1911548 RepID=A0A917D8Q1_9BACI|nr:pyruvate, water dikinase regulatory protein [Lysinibacillus alkalisoli]GGG13747.1 putative pyruvate, phosphate dikinase regulatory protein [Lysinibacillus alkalisoli]